MDIVWYTTYEYYVTSITERNGMVLALDFNSLLCESVCKKVTLCATQSATRFNIYVVP